MISDRRIGKAREEHRKALEGYSRSALRLSDEEWLAPRSGGGWSPAAITEHLILAYDVALRQISGGEGATPIVGPIRATLLRWVLLPHILFHRTLPKTRAPRETHPEGVSGPPEAAVQRLRETAARFEQLALDPVRISARSLHHPYFGCITSFQFLRLSAVHIEHHGRQLCAGREMLR